MFNERLKDLRKEIVEAALSAEHYLGVPVLPPGWELFLDSTLQLAAEHRAKEYAALVEHQKRLEDGREPCVF